MSTDTRALRKSLNVLAAHRQHLVPLLDELDALRVERDALRARVEAADRLLETFIGYREDTSRAELLDVRAALSEQTGGTR